MTTCQIEEINKGSPYPKSCPTCGLGGKCVKGLPHPFTKPDQGPAVVDFAKIKVGDRVLLGGEFDVVGVTGPSAYPLAVKVDGEELDIALGMVAAHLPAPRPIEVGCTVKAFDGNISAHYRVEHIIGDAAWLHPLNRPSCDIIRLLGDVQRIDDAGAPC